MVKCKKFPISLCARQKPGIWQVVVAQMISRQDGAAPPTAYCPTGLDIVHKKQMGNEIGILCFGCGVV